MERLDRSQSSVPLVWVWVLFWGVLVFMDLPGGTNVNSRYAALKAMVADGTLSIDAYHQDSMDWSRTPAGTYYSNKAPGPVLLAYPLFWVWDGFTARWVLPTRASQDERRDFLGFTALKLLSLFLQIVPFALLVAWAMGRIKAPPLIWAAVLLGNTGSLYLNSYFGHGMAAVFVLGAVLAFSQSRFVGAGLLLGLGVLCDYGVALLVLPALVWAGRKHGVRLVLGGLGPLVVFGLYHWACFGAPWHLPMRYQNPLFVTDPGGMWGVLRGAPDPMTVVNLLVGPSRGLLWTQPWVLVLAVVGWRVRPVRFGLVGLALLIGMNATFGAWHGGHTSGPRYLSPVLPALGLGAVWIWSGLGDVSRRALATTAALGVAVHLGIFLSGVSAAPTGALWPQVGQALWSPTAVARSMVLVLAGLGLWLTPLLADRLRRPGWRSAE